MARSLRIESAGAFYHVMARGNLRQTIFHDEEDHLFFLRTLADACERTGWRVHAWVLMSSHYHLFLATPESWVSHLRRGWYWGNQGFGEKMAKLAQRLIRGKGKPRSRGYRAEVPVRRHDEREAQRWLEEGLTAAGLRRAELERLPGSDPRKVLIAERLWRETVAPCPLRGLLATLGPGCAPTSPVARNSAPTTKPSSFGLA